METFLIKTNHIKKIIVTFNYDHGVGTFELVPNIILQGFPFKDSIILLNKIKNHPFNISMLQSSKN